MLCKSAVLGYASGYGVRRVLRSEKTLSLVDGTQNGARLRLACRVIKRKKIQRLITEHTCCSRPDVVRHDSMIDIS